MKKFIAALKSAPKRSALLAIIAAAVVVPASLLAWGPGRDEIDPETGADHVVFNSITNNPNYGNERQFITVREAGNTSESNYFRNDITVQPGKEYEVRVLIHNDANTDRYDGTHEGYPKKDLRAINTTLKTAISPDTGTSSAITAYLSADNATPQKIWSDIKFNSGNGQQFNLAYIQGSARIYNNGYAAGGEGKPFSDMMTTQSGAKVGFEKEGDGIVPGCYHYISYVYFKVKPQFAKTPDFTVEKSVSKIDGDKYHWKKDLTIEPGETVAYRIKYKNTGEVQNDNVVVQDKLPAHMSYVPGSTMLFNSQNMNGKQLTDGVTDKGINIGSHAPGGASYVVFKAKADSAKELECGTNTLTNKATVETDYGQKSDTADVEVNKECQPPIYTCDALSINKVNDYTYKFESGYTVKNGSFKSASYAVYDADGNKVATVQGTPNSATYTQTTPGTYTVKATVTFTVNGEDVTATSEDCADSFTVPTPQPGNIIVCDLSSNTVITIKESEFDSSKHTKDLSKCQSAPEMCTIPGKEHLPVNSPECVAAPEELPTTGMEDSLGTLVGLLAIVTSAGYYLVSRRGLGL